MALGLEGIDPSLVRRLVIDAPIASLCMSIGAEWAVKNGMVRGTAAHGIQVERLDALMEALYRWLRTQDRAAIGRIDADIHKYHVRYGCSNAAVIAARLVDLIEGEA